MSCLQAGLLGRQEARQVQLPLRRSFGGGEGEVDQGEGMFFVV